MPVWRAVGRFLGSEWQVSSRLCLLRAVCGRLPGGNGGGVEGTVNPVLVTNFRWLGVRATLMELTFDQVVELWWHCQQFRAEEEERHAQRLADPDSLYGKTPEQVEAYFEARRQPHDDPSNQ